MPTTDQMTQTDSSPSRSHDDHNDTESTPTPTNHPRYTEQKSALLSLSPLSGRYASRTASLQPLFSEFGYIQYRIRIEIEYLIRLRHTLHERSMCEVTDSFSPPVSPPRLPPTPPASYWTQWDQTDDDLRAIYTNLSLQEAVDIKHTEKRIHHDVKSIEYFIKSRIPEGYQEWVHFGLTSQDVNNPAMSLAVHECRERLLLPGLTSILDQCNTFYTQWVDVPMLSRTHGQPATPTTVGKEVYVYHERLSQEIEVFRSIPIRTKCGGAVGNLNAHYIAYPDIDWVEWCDQFVASLGLQRNRWTTQIDHYDSLARILDSVKRCSVILVDLCQDIWHYISFGYFKLRTAPQEVGSSTMPHKVNPIHFENAEGNLKLCGRLASTLSEALPVSRLQRDLTDSTLLRNIGTVFGHFLIGIQSITTGCRQLDIHRPALDKDIADHPMVLAEAIQTVMRAEQVPHPYETLKALTQHKDITLEDLYAFVRTLEISEEARARLLQLTPVNYYGCVRDL